MMVQILSLLIVAVVVFFLLRKEKAKNDRYFGKQGKYTKKERQILEHYKSIYKPIPANDQLPVLHRDGFELEDVALSATKIVYDRPIPSQEDIGKIKKGWLVKLLFVDKDNYVERMWVEVLEKNKNFFTGVLRNDAHEMDAPKYGKEIHFHSNHIYDIDEEKN